MKLTSQRISAFCAGLAVCFLAISTATSWAALPRQVQVRLFEAYPRIQAFQLQGPVKVVAPVHRFLKSATLTVQGKQGQIEIRDRQSGSVLLKAGKIVIKPSHGTVGLLPLDSKIRQARQYPGMIEFRLQDGNILALNTLPTRDYIALVISSETPSPWPLEALKAQAVLTQTRLARYRPGDTLGDSTQQEAYLGETHRKPEANRAVSAVWGQTLAYRHQAITPYYHASCAGHTSDGAYFQSDQAMPWLIGVRCPYCAHAPFAKPTISTIPGDVFQRAFPGAFPEVLRVDAAGRPLSLRQGGTIRSGYAFWIQLGQKLGWDKAPGTRFSLSKLPDGRVRLTSTGAGHGVGLCQWGAATMARQGKSWREILRFYFPQAELE